MKTTILPMLLLAVGVGGVFGGIALGTRDMHYGWAILAAGLASIAVAYRAMRPKGDAGSVTEVSPDGS